MAVTIYDVARQAGVSPTTVSSVLNDDPRVKDSTRVRVKEVVEKLGYVRNSNARGLAKGETKTIGIIIALETKSTNPYEVKHEGDHFMYSVSNAIIDRMTEMEYSVLTERYRLADAGGELPQMVKNARVDGVILIGGLFHREIIEKIRSHGIPLTGACVIDESIDTANYDLTQATYLIAEELIRSGCQNVALLNASRCYRTSYTRARGWDRAMKQYGSRQLQHREILLGTNTGGAGYLAMKELWEQGICPDGIATANWMIAVGAMRYLSEHGIRVPEDVSVTTMGDHRLSTYAIPPITTVNIHEEEIGRRAAELLLRRIKTPDAPIEHDDIGVELVRGGSVRKGSV